MTGWLAREIKAIIPDNERVLVGPHVCGGMTLPSEVIVEQIKIHLGMETEKLRM